MGLSRLFPVSFPFQGIGIPASAEQRHVSDSLGQSSMGVGTWTRLWLCRAGHINRKKGLCHARTNATSLLFSSEDTILLDQ